MDINQLLANLINDWPILGVLLAILIGLYRLGGRTLDITDKHLAILILNLEKIADEIQRKQQERNRD